MVDALFCGACGSRYSDLAWPRTCSQCGEIKYRNPLPAVMVLQPVLTSDLGILLVRRGIEPGYGKYGLPGGYMDHGESWQEAGARELFEETGVVVAPDELTLFGVNSPPSRKVVIIFAKAPPVNRLPEFERNEEVLERLVSKKGQKLEMAFPSHTLMLEKFWR